MLIESILLGLIFVLIRRGRLSNIIINSKNSIICLSIIAIIHMVFVIAEKLEISIINKFVIENLYYIKISIYMFILLILLFNIKSSKLPIAIIVLGLLLNGSVILFNKQIIDKSEYTNLVVEASYLENNEIKLASLLDTIELPKQYIFRDYISIGDIFISVGVFLYIQDITSRNKIYRLFN